MIHHNPDDAHALVLNRILVLPKGSEASNQAFRDYQATRLKVIRPKLLQQKVLLRRSLLGDLDLDAQVTALDDEIAADWFALDSRIALGATGARGAA